MNFLARILTGLVVTALTVGLLLLAGFQLWQAAQDPGRGGPARQAQEMVYTAALTTVQAQSLAPVLEVYGTVQSRRMLELRAGTGGQIVYIAPEMYEGGEVAAGQVLFRLDPATAEAARDTQRAALADARQNATDSAAHLDIARDDLAAAEEQARLREAASQRQQELGNRGLGTSADRETAALAASTARQAVLSRRAALVQAESAVGAAESAVLRAEIALREAERALSDTEIRAGFAGTVTAVAAIEGGLVSANEQLARIIDPDALEVALPLSLDQFARLTRDGQIDGVEAWLSPGAGAAPIPARLDRSAASVAEGSAGRVVYAALGPEARLLRPGDFVRVSVVEPVLHDAALIPAGAVGGDGAVLVADAEGRLSAVAVEVLRLQGDDVVIAAGELDGARIVSERGPQLGAGIRIREPGAAPEASGRQRETGGTVRRETRPDGDTTPTANPSPDTATPTAQPNTAGAALSDTATTDATAPQAQPQAAGAALPETATPDTAAPPAQPQAGAALPDTATPPTAAPPVQPQTAGAALPETATPDTAIRPAQPNTARAPLPDAATAETAAPPAQPQAAGATLPDSATPDTAAFPVQPQTRGAALPDTAVPPAQTQAGAALPDTATPPSVEPPVQPQTVGAPLTDAMPPAQPQAATAPPHSDPSPQATSSAPQAARPSSGGAQAVPLRGGDG
ncbi:MAG: HlyD family efflux transporter periplasmic adaptor subunit [Paracoccus sp. (in: a-proteobacteria)]|nr:HlyD family efflux transporter periplasmic adaptor subunit [Paracoccus sp. (in: a-proteobacteria)]